MTEKWDESKWLRHADLGHQVATRICARCGCIVASLLVDKHDQWHEPQGGTR